jgi:CubicO group peptidase (beta-lactamase class C family)
VADVEMDVAAGPETVYRIGSLTKQFTAAAVMRLVERGELSLDDPLTDYLPDYPVQGHTVTIRHLLNHTSGIQSYTSLGEDFWDIARLDLTEDELIDLFADLEFDFEPGADYDYNNSAYYLLGVILGKVSGTPYSQYIEASLLEPLGLDRTLYCDTRRIIEDRARGYEYDDGELRNADFISMANPGAAGALCSTVADLVRWTELLHDGAVVSPSSLEAMTSPTILSSGDTASYGFGLGLGDLEGHRRIAHGGGINGFVTYLSRYPERELTIAVLTNADGGNASGIEQALARTAFGLELIKVEDLPLSDAELRRYTGRFMLQVGDDQLPMRVYAEDGHLYVRAEGQSAFRLRYQGDDVFVPVFDDNVRLVFEGDGRLADAVTLYQGGGEFRGERVN